MSPKTILLVNPWIHDFAAYDLWVRPLGLLTLASLLRRSGFQVQMIDCLDSHRTVSGPPGNLKRMESGCGKFSSEVISKPDALRSIRRRYRRYGIPPALFRQKLQAVARPDVVLVGSMMTYWYPGVFEAITEVRAVWPGATILLGGNYATLCRDHARVFSGADAVVTGDGEFSLPPVLGDLFGCIVELPFDGDDLDSYPYPAMDLSPHLESVPILTSRGCPYRCTYCASHLLSRRFRTRDPIRVVDEIEHWSRTLGTRNVAFYDDALLANPKDRAVPMLEEILRRGLSIHFHCPNGLHLREITARLAHLLYKTGFRTIRFGYETASAERQLQSGGKVTTEELRQAVAYLREAGYHPADIGIYLLCGLPGQEVREMVKGIELVLGIGARPILTEYSPIPGTSLWDEAVSLSRHDIVREPLFHNNSLLPCLRNDVSPADFQRLKNQTRVSPQRADLSEKD